MLGLRVPDSSTLVAELQGARGASVGLSQRATTAASQWCHSGIAVVPYQQHPLVKISLSTNLTALSKSL